MLVRFTFALMIWCLLWMIFDLFVGYYTMAAIMFICGIVNAFTIRKELNE